MPFRTEGPGQSLQAGICGKWRRLSCTQLAQQAHRRAAHWAQGRLVSQTQARVCSMLRAVSQEGAQGRAGPHCPQACQRAGGAY